MESTFGADSAAVTVRVDGEFAREGTDSVIGLALLEAAVARWSAAGLAAAIGPLEIGVDPGRYGDDASIIVGRRGLFAMPCVELRGKSTIEVAAAARDYAAKHAPGERPTIRVDEGGLGAGVLDALRAAAGPYDAIGVNASHSPRVPRFKNARAELHFAVRRWLERGGALPPDDLRDGELLAARYSTDAGLRIQIESKDDIKRRLRRSPDRADALALACYSENPLEEVARTASPIVQPRIETAIDRLWGHGPGGGPAGPLGWLPGDRPDGFAREPARPQWSAGMKPRRRWE